MVMPPTEGAAPPRPSAPMVESVEEEEERQSKAKLPSPPKQPAAKGKDEQKEAMLDKLFNFKAGPKRAAAQPKLGELLHLDNVSLPASKQNSGSDLLTPKPPPSLWDLKPPTSLPALAAADAEVFSLPPALGESGERVEKLVSDEGSLHPSVATATLAPREGKAIGTETFDEGVTGVAEGLAKQVEVEERGEEADSLTMDHFTLLRLVGKVCPTRWLCPCRPMPIVTDVSKPSPSLETVVNPCFDA